MLEHLEKKTSTAKEETQSQKADSRQQHLFWRLAPLAVVITGILVSLYGWSSAKEYTRERNEAYFQTLVGDTQDALNTRFSLYLQSLWGAAGFLAGSDQVYQQEWSTYVAALNPAERLPGILGIDYVDYVLNEDLPDYLENIPQESLEKFANYPETDHPDKFIIRFVGSVEDSGNVLGTDIGFDDVRRHAAEQARDTGNPTITGTIRRQIANSGEDSAPSFLLLIPSYQDGVVPQTLELRRRNIRGWVDAPFVGDYLLQDLNEISRGQIAFSVYDGPETTPEQLIFSHDENTVSAFSGRTTNEFAGATWTILWQSTDLFMPPANLHTPQYLLAFGLLSTFLVALLLQVLVRQNALVNQRVKLRTQELQAAKRHAEKADAMKSDFLANMSHELRTPLNGIIGTVDLIMNTELTERQYEYANIISRSGESLLLLINDILDISKIEAGELKINPERFVLRHMLKDAIQPQLSKAKQNSTELNVDYDLNTPYGVVGDPLRISQIIINLVGNAIKFSDQGSVTVHVDHEELANEKAVLKFRIEDSGIGIAPDRIHEIFGKFAQADGKITRKYGGTGLGLAISKNLVELMGGEIGVESIPGEGSTFWFTVPVEIAQREPPEKQSVDMENIAKKRVLVIEPSPTTSRIISSYLTRFGTHHETAASIQEGRKLAEESPYDACIVSTNLPESEVQAFVHKPPAKRGTAMEFILITSVTDIPEMGAIKSSGFSSFILKPVYPDDLMEALVRSGGLESFRKQVRKRRHTVAEDTKVLLVEDDPINQQVAGRMLEELGYNYDIAKNGLVALQMAQKDSYDVALMDVMMPEMDGYTATQKLRVMQQEKLIRYFPIIALTANAMREQIDKCIDAGMDDFLTKPVRQRILEEKLEEWLSEPEKSPDEEAPASEETPSAQSDGPTLDREQLDDLKSVMGDGYEDFINLSQENIGKLVEELQNAVSANEYEKIYQSAHSLISNCAYIGASGASAIAREIESLAHPSENPDAKAKEAITPLLDKLIAEIEGVKPLLKS